MEGRTCQLSFIIPMWNRSRTICSCLDSILCQASDFLFEIIVVDDASTDASISIVKEIAGLNSKKRLVDSTISGRLPVTEAFFQNIDEKDEYEIRSRIKLFVLDENNGAATARNMGLEKVNGDYIWFVDSDDFIAMGALRKLSHVISSKKYDVLCFSTKKMSSLPESYIIESPSTGLLNIDCSDSRDLLFLLRSGTVWSRIFKRDFVKKYRFNPQYKYSEDSQFVWRTTLDASEMAFVRDCLYGYMYNPNSLTNVKPYERFACYINVVEDYLTAIQKSSKHPSCKKTLVRECEKRLYTHAFYTFDYAEITSQMWKQWYKVYYRTMIKNNMRRKIERVVSWIIWSIRCNKLFFLLFCSMVNNKNKSIVR